MPTVFPSRCECSPCVINTNCVTLNLPFIQVWLKYSMYKLITQVKPPFLTFTMDMPVTIATVTKVNIKDADFRNSSLITDDSTLTPTEAQVYLSNWIIN